jgi:amino acid transporter
MAIANRLKSYVTSKSTASSDGLEEHDLSEKNVAFISRDSDLEDSSDSQAEFDPVGAPVEKNNPLGYNVNYVSLIYLTVSGVIGTGIFSTPGTVLQLIGSVGASYVLWIVWFIIAAFRLMVYIEYIQYFPNRGGGDVVFLEHLLSDTLPFAVPTSFAAVNVILSFLNSSAIAFGQYMLRAADAEPKEWSQKGIATGILAFTCILATLSTKWSLKLSNWIGHAKIISLLFIAVTGFVVLAGGTSVEDPHANFRNSWEGTTGSNGASNIASAILKVSFAYGGLQYPVAVVNELPSKKRMFGFKVLVPITLFVIFILYILCITAFFAGAGTIDEIKSSGVLTASLFFENVFKTKAATRALSVLVGLSAFGHLIPAVVSHSRSLRECGRQGVLPFRNFWVATNWHGLTAPGPILVTFIVNTIVSLAIPSGSAYNFIISLGSYAGNIFDLQLSVGLIFLRRKRAKAGLERKSFQIPVVLLIIQQAYQLFVVIMPFVPPKDAAGKILLRAKDLGFFYASYCVTAIGLLVLCYLYYVFWQFIVPNLYGYKHRVERYELSNGELGNRIIKVKNENLEEWDALHGKSLRLHRMEDEISETTEDPAESLEVAIPPAKV